MTKSNSAKKQKQSTAIIAETHELEVATASEQIEQLDNESLLARWELEKWSVLRELSRSRINLITFYTKPEGGGLTMEEAVKKACEKLDEKDFEDHLDQIATWDVANISWGTLDLVFRQNPDFAQQIWEDIKEEAEKDFKSGHFAAGLFERTEWQREAWKRAHFIAVRNSFIEQFKPQGGIDYSMIDILAVSFFLWMYWTEKHIERETTEGIEPLSETERKHAEKWGGEWITPRVCVQESIEQAAQMADRYRRAYQSQLRSMRDWRRYNVPVTINNPQQVNIAADGGQQVNLSQSKDD
jgi:hypothetical protein